MIIPKSGTSLQKSIGQSIVTLFLHSYRAKVRWAQSRKELTQGSKVTDIEATTYISTPLQYSRLENPMEGGAWWAAIYGVAQSRKRLK